jgi:hypothetical protein
MHTAVAAPAPCAATGDIYLVNSPLDVPFVDLVISYGTRPAAIQRAGADCFTVLDRNLTRVGATCDPVGDPPAAHPMDLWVVQGRTPDARFQGPAVAHRRPARGCRLGGGFARALVPRDQPFTALDGFAYNPNVPRWMYGARQAERSISGLDGLPRPAGRPRAQRAAARLPVTRAAGRGDRATERSSTG